MAKRLHMTTADYVAIAISPALIMALVGSLVFFLIEVMYTGDYVARLDYAFALFVFAAGAVGVVSGKSDGERLTRCAKPQAMRIIILRRQINLLLDKNRSFDDDRENTPLGFLHSGELAC